MLIELIRSNMDIQLKLFIALIMLFALTLSFSIHEFMHAFTADWLGDPTPRSMGRLTLNPLAHMDPMGTVLLLVAGFGWGKPVVYNPRKLNRFKSYRGMNIMVHLAGVTGNFVLALICSIINVFLVTLLDVNQPAVYALCQVFSYTAVFSLMLMAFNLLPIPPLDGFHVLEELMPLKLKYSEGYKKFQRFAPLILMIVFVLSASGQIPILGSVIDVIQFPFAWVINTICNGLVRLLSGI
jgi:Zn-dependent protease